MRVRDPVHGFIEYDEPEERVINSAPLQRLRGISQLAMASLVYPGALHTRFGHSLGVMYVAGRVADHLKLADEERTLVRLAALLHDVGHGPYSHVSERPLAHCTKTYGERQDIETSKLHECITADIVRTHHGVRQAVGAELAEAIASLLDPRMQRVRSVTRDIISGALDADKFDYLLRDSYYAGVPYGLFDLEWMIGSLDCARERDESYLVVREKSVCAAEQYLMASYHMMKQVYTHRIRRVSDGLLARAISYAAEDNVGEIRRLYTYQRADPDYLDLHLSYDDARLLQEITQRGPGSRADKLIQRLRARELPRKVYQTWLPRLAPLFARRLESEADGPELVDQLEKKVATECSKERDLVLIDLLRVDPPEPTAFEGSVNAEEILVRRQGQSPPQSDHTGRDRPQQFCEFSRIFDRRLTTRAQITVFVPMDASTHDGIAQEEADLKAKIREIIAEFAGGD